MVALLRRARIAVVLIVTLVLGGPGTAAIAELPVRPTESHIDESLADIEVSSPVYDEARREYDTARDGRVEAQREVDRLTGAETAQRGVVDAATQAVDIARRRVGRTRRALRAMAVSAYVGIEGTAPASTLADDVVHDDDARVVVAEIVGQDRAADVTRARRGVVRSERDLTQAEAELASIRGALAEVEALRDRLLESELTLAPDIEDARAVARVVGHDLTLVALDAYAAAARVVALTDPSCGLEWELLAGIGRIESGHGTFGGTALSPAGVTEGKIRGIALTGGGGTALIGDTDGGSLDGDREYDRAVGPMQFIPSTWVSWARDGDDDGIADPHDIYDAALTAGAYLCASGGGLDTDAGRSRAVLSYNHSQSYVAQVLANAEDYRSIDL